MKETRKGRAFLWRLGLDTIRELEVDSGILASGRNELYGCVFGRDSLITSLKLLRAYRRTDNRYFLQLVRKILLSLAKLQGCEVNIESGEEPGKCIHEYRATGHEHLTQRPADPWFVYPDHTMRNYDSVDSTPLYLIATFRYYQLSHDEDFLRQIELPVHASLKWMLEFGDHNGDGFIDYQMHPDRRHGGLIAQNWMDSAESLFHEDGMPIVFPIAPVEVQAYAYLALMLWSKYFKQIDGAPLRSVAEHLKMRFNKHFVLVSEQGNVFASAIDGVGKPLRAVRSSIGHCLWASLEQDLDGTVDSILEGAAVPQVVQRLLARDMFESQAGIRTLSARSAKFRPNSYHNGSIWPHDTAMIVEGMEIHGFDHEAGRVRRALLRAMSHFATPLELFVFDQKHYSEYLSENGQTACRTQAWAAASLVAEAMRKQPKARDTVPATASDTNETLELQVG